MYSVKPEEIYEVVFFFWNRIAIIHRACKVVGRGSSFDPTSAAPSSPPALSPVSAPSLYCISTRTGPGISIITSLRILCREGVEVGFQVEVGVHRVLVH